MDFRMLAMEPLIVQPDMASQGRIRLMSRAFLLALAVASQPKPKSSEPLDRTVLLPLQRYFQFLGVRASLETLEIYLTVDPVAVDEGWKALKELTINLNIVPMEPLLGMPFAEFKDRLEADLSA